MTIRLAFAGLLAIGALFAQAPAPARPKPEAVVMRGGRFAPRTWSEMDAMQLKLVEQALAEPLPTVNGPYNALISLA